VIFCRRCGEGDSHPFKIPCPSWGIVEPFFSRRPTEAGHGGDDEQPDQAGRHGIQPRSQLIHPEAREAPPHPWKLNTKRRLEEAEPGQLEVPRSELEGRLPAPKNSVTVISRRSGPSRRTPLDQTPSSGHSMHEPPTISLSPSAGRTAPTASTRNPSGRRTSAAAEECSARDPPAWELTTSTSERGSRRHDPGEAQDQRHLVESRPRRYEAVGPAPTVTMIKPEAMDVIAIKLDGDVGVRDQRSARTAWKPHERRRQRTSRSGAARNTRSPLARREGSLVNSLKTSAAVRPLGPTLLGRNGGGCRREPSHRPS